MRLAADPLTEAGEGFQIECSYGLALLPAQASSSEGALQVVACLGLLALAAGALAASPLPQRAKAYATDGNHHGVSVTLVTSASNPKRLEPGEAATASQFAFSGGDVHCKKAKKGPGFHEVSFAVFGFPGATLKLTHGKYGFSKTTKERNTSALGGTGTLFNLKVKIVGTVVSPSSIKGTVKATGGPCTTKKPVAFTAKLDPKIPVAPGQ